METKDGSRRVAGCVLGLFAVFVLIAEVLETRARNRVWRDEQSLWADAVKKSPNDGRAWMNLGVAVMAKGDFLAAEKFFEVARLCAPDYHLVYVNLGILYGATGRDGEAETNFRRAVELAPNDPNSHAYYDAWRLKHKEN